MRPGPLSRVPAGALALAVVAGTLVALPTAQAADAPLTIAQIQGTGAATPYAGKPVTTEPSVVTAVYGQGSGDFRGFVLQTPGTGGRSRDLTRASDAVFVHLASTPFDVQRGDVVSVSGTAGEFAGLTQIAGAVTVTPVTGRFPAARPLTGLRWAATAAQRENLESMLWQSQDRFTVADTYPLLRFGELGLSAGGPLVQPTDVADAGSAAAAARAARNEALAVNLDDGTNRGFAVTSSLPARAVPYLQAGRAVAVGDTLRLREPVIVDWRNGTWKFNPTTPVVAGQEVARIRHRRVGVPEVGGRLSVASFNVLNYFTTTGQGRTGCTGGNLDTEGSYNVTNGCDARGAWDGADLRRQQAKITAALNTLDASVVGLMEIENSVTLGEPVDEATATLVAALNAAAGYRKWAYVPSSDQLQPVEDQDVITNALIYQPREVRLEGDAYAFGAGAREGAPFANARTPIAAAFTPRRGGRPVLVVVNHFKSKSGSSSATGDNDEDLSQGQGAFNGDRVRQAQALLGWLPDVQRASRTSATALLGDFNAYTQEDPMQALYAGGYRNAAPASQHSYSFDGLLGSLDHVLLDEAAARRLTRAQVWNINAGQSPALEYSQYRTTAVDYYRPDPLRSSDHDPVVAGLRR
jgi:predicted extracellular nuclease